ncbi:uncharacterized protein LOC124449551 [Xenia sp. Carnegie-2017]|uniref:uncharacterized protein LOC124449551 n=1 Tax=Xenia sp. Carnegie-2017 TaxID=2897299 RepID=UPI001F03AF77|nr:uncharacterized protein LOC124449551 [Xenia sp. Carnegie-2017]
MSFYMKRKWMSYYKREVESENIPSTSSEPQEQIEETTCDEPVLEKEVAVQCELQCQNCLKLEKEKRRYRNLWLGEKLKLQCSRTYASSSNMDMLAVDEYDNNSSNEESSTSCKVVDLDSCPAEEILDPNDLSGDSDSESDLGAEQS